jgi:hypothetical protein
MFVCFCACALKAEFSAPAPCGAIDDENMGIPTI